MNTGVCKRSRRRFSELSSFNAWNGFENTVVAFFLFPHVGIIVYRHGHVCIYERCTASVCWSYGQGDTGQGMHIGQSGGRENGQVPAAFV
jgi:hypothetical protein